MQYIEGVVNSRLPRSKAFGAAVFLRRWSRKSSDFRIDFIDVILRRRACETEKMGLRPAGGFPAGGLFCMPALAAADDVADAVEQTWGDASEQIKTVVDSVVFPALGMVLAIAFFVKLAMAYFDYRKHGQFEWTGPGYYFVMLNFRPAGPKLHLGHCGALTL